MPANLINAILEGIEEVLSSMISESFTTQKKRFQSQGIDSNEIDAVFTKFKQLKDRGVLSPGEKDVDRYKSFDELRAVVIRKETVVTKSQSKRQDKERGAELVYEDEEWLVYHITTPGAASLYGERTKWCITDTKAFVGYVLAGATFYYAISKVRSSKDPLYKVAVKVDKEGERQVWNAKDKEIRLNKISGIPEKLFAWKQLSAEAAVEHPQLAYYYAENVIKRRWPEVEPLIARDPELAALYAENVIKGRWPEGEPAIASSASWAALYAQNVIKRRWPEVEPLIARDSEWAAHYAQNVIKGRWPEVEPAIARSPRLAYYYALNVIKGRWPEGEPAIARDREFSPHYALNVIKGRWPEGGVESA